MKMKHGTGMRGTSLTSLTALPLAVFAVVMAMVMGTFQSFANGKAEHVVVLVWDGMRPDFITPQFAPNLYAKVPYDPLKDFVPITTLAVAPTVLVVNKDFPAQSLEELIRVVRAAPGKYSYASGGIGTSTHITGEIFKMQTGTDLLHVPFKGGGPALAAIVAGEVNMILDTAASGMPHVRTGRLRALAIDTPKRHPAFPDLPTFAEQGMPDYTVATCPNPAVRFLRADDSSAPSLAIAAGADGNVALITLSEGTGPATAEGIRLGSTVAEAKATYPGLVPSQGFDDRYTLEGAPGFITFSTGQLNVGDGAPIFSISVVAGGLPPKELCGFARLSLAPGETGTARFRLGPRVFSFWDPASRAFRLEPGEFELLAGRSCVDLRARAGVTL